jgi:cyclic beta-1,2-glucan synthetase
VFNGHVWSAGYQPIGRESEIYEVDFFEDRAEFRRKDGPIRTVMEIIVSPEDDAEVRYLSLTNEGRGVREIELTSYSEVVLSPPAADSRAFPRPRTRRAQCRLHHGCETLVQFGGHRA